jgi:hypothetical protein
MCAPRNNLVKLAILGAAAYATGGVAAGSIFSTSGGSLATAQTVNTASTLSRLATAAKYALPVIGSAGSIYGGYVQANLLRQQANMVDYSIGQDREAFALRKAKRQRELVLAIGKQRARYGLTGVTLEGSPGDVLSLTAANFAEDQYIDAFNTSGSILSKEQKKDTLNKEADYSIVGGYTKAAQYLGTRGFSDLLTTQTNTGTTSVDITSTEGSS